MIKYLGSKRSLLTTLLDAIARPARSETVLDLFSGTSRVGHALKASGRRVLANDHNAYAATLAACYVAADREDVFADAERLVREFNALPGRPGYFTETFCERARYVQPRNGARIDAIREEIAAKGLPPDLEAVMLTSLMEAADRVDSTTGVQMAYLKDWSRRSGRDLELRTPDVLPRAAAGKGEARRLDAFEAAAALTADVAYVDPPYNRHSYLGNYHVWESLVLWDKAPHYGIACKRTDVRTRRSAFNSRPTFEATLARLFRALRVDAIVVSFSDEGFLPRGRMEALLGELWDGEAAVEIVARRRPRYVGARIGIYNREGERVGRPGRLSNTEFVYVARRREAANAAPLTPTLLASGVAADVPAEVVARCAEEAP